MATSRSGRADQRPVVRVQQLRRRRGHPLITAPRLAYPPSFDANGMHLWPRIRTAA